MNDENRGSSLRGAVLTVSRVGGIGCSVPIILIAAILIGRKLDAWFGTAPWILLLMLFGGIVLSTAFMISSAYQASQVAYREYQARRPADAGGHVPDDYPRDPYGEEGH